MQHVDDEFQSAATRQNEVEEWRAIFQKQKLVCASLDCRQGLGNDHALDTTARYIAAISPVLAHGHMRAKSTGSSSDNLHQRYQCNNAGSVEHETKNVFLIVGDHLAGRLSGLHLNLDPPKKCRFQHRHRGQGVPSGRDGPFRSAHPS